MMRIFKVLSAFVIIIVLFTFLQVPKTVASQTIGTQLTGSQTNVSHAGAAYTDSSQASRELLERLKGTVVMYAGSRLAFIDGREASIDGQNDEIVPILKEGRLYVPIGFTAQSLGAETSWNAADSSAVISLPDRAFKLRYKKNCIDVIANGGSYSVDAVYTGGRGFMPVEALSDLMGKKVFLYEGLVVISDTEGLFDPENDSLLIDELISKVNGLPVLGSYEMLRKLLENAQEKGIYGRGRTIIVTFSEAMDAGAANSTAGSEQSQAAAYGAVSKKAVETVDGVQDDSDYSTTNTQVEGVDEADIVKTDGTFIYHVNRGRIAVMRAYPAEDMKVENMLEFSDSNFSPREMYLHENLLVVIGSTYRTGTPYISDAEPDNANKTGAITDTADETDALRYPPAYWSESTKALILDVSDKADIKQLREAELDGSYISSRKIGSSLYFVTNKYIDLAYIMRTDNKDYALPYYRDTAAGSNFNILSYSDIRYFPGAVEPNYMLVAGIDLDKADVEAKVSAYLGSGENVYASQNNLYVAVTSYNVQEPVSNDDQKVRAEVITGTGNSGGENAGLDNSAGADSDSGGPDSGSTGSDDSGNSGAISSDGPDSDSTGSDDSGNSGATSAKVVNGNVQVVIAPFSYISYSEPNTVIYKFALNGGGVEYTCKGTVPGRILNQFSMDEYGQYFRIATNTGEIWRNNEFTSKNNIYVLDGKLQEVGKIEGIAPGEKIYSVRFMGERGYVVTFKTVDPLFVISFKDPARPEILGALKIPGYSDYLHPYDENHIIGFGKDTVEVKGGAFYLGIKMAVFDITDVNNPRELFTEKIGDRGTESELLRNHKALLFSREKNLLAFPVTLMEVKDGQKFDASGYPQYGQFTFQGAYVYNLDLENGFSLKARITHLTDSELLRSGNGWYENNKNVQRILYIDEVLYTLSEGMLKANSLSDFRELNALPVY